MSKPPKLDLKTLIAQGQAAQPDDLLPESAPAPTAKVLTLPPAQAAAPAKGAAKAAPEREGQGTLKERARQMSLYLEPAVYEQLRELAFTERTKIHPLLIEAIDLLFKKRGLKSIKQLTAEADKDQRITG